MRIFLIPALSLLLCGSVGLAEEPGTEADTISRGSRVVIEQTEKGYQLYRNGEPYYIKGAGAKGDLQALAEAGANSIRTWSAAHIKNLLDAAHEQGLTVTIGLWMGQERHGFDYTDPKEVKRQFETAKRHVNQFKHHPALLIWGVGNEAEWIDGTNSLIYQAVEEVAKMIKQEDPDHPTMIVLAELGEYSIKLDYVKELCPSIDILGVNSFGGCATLPERLRASGWTKPYLVTEFGPPGPWESPKTPWGAEIELHSTEKAKFYFTSYMKGIYRHRDWCLGSYAFFWGDKFEVTPTWFSMVQKDVGRYGSAQYMTAAWSRKWPENRSPEIEPIESRLVQSVVRKGGQFEATVEATDPDGDPLTYRWELMSESKHKDKDGLTQTRLKPLLKSFAEEDGNRVVVNVPSHPGMYRLFVYVTDGQGNAATANTPFKAQ